MAKANSWSSRLGRLLALIAGLLLVGGLLYAADPPTPVKPSTPPVEVKPLTGAPGVFIPEQVKVINQRIAEKWKEQKTPLAPSQRCTDYEFIRRASLDI